MSVLVKGMSIPDNCESCAFATGFGFCLAKSDNFCGYTNDRKRPEWCPLVEVSEPHGRLIDENDVIELLSKGWKLSVYPNATNVHGLKGVIEAEGE